jgi:pimeloyl-ACP methyl ester carboxylesterase
MMRELILDVPHARLSAVAWGDSSLPPLLALHGWLDNAASFNAIAPLLCEHFHFVAIDMPGHGRSAHAPSYQFIDGIFDTLAAADALGWQTFDLLGHSRGAGIASLTAAACPERIRRLALIEALGAMTTAPEHSAAQLRRAITQARELAAKPLRVFTTPEEAVTARMKAGALSLAAAEAIVLRGIRPVVGGYSWSSDPRLTIASPQRFTEPQVLDIVGAIEAPTLLIVAPDSQVKPIGVAAFAARVAQVRNIEVREISGGHHLHLENPNPVAQAILDFLQRD